MCIRDSRLPLSDLRGPPPMAPKSDPGTACPAWSSVPFPLTDRNPTEFRQKRQNSGKFCQLVRVEI
eukprot:3062297-Pyramimonas_sp.AAC.1